MRVEIVAVGSELLNGDLRDGHTARLGAFLRGLGLGLRWGQVVGDELATVVEALRIAGQRSDLVLVSGGLGPTGDDLTMDAASVVTGRPLCEDPHTLRRIRERYERLGRDMPPPVAKQALIPEGAYALDNREGTAPGVRLVHDGATYFFFPGVPRELEALVDDHLRPWLDAHAPVRPRRSHTFKTYGKTESGTAALLEGMAVDPRLTVAYRAHFPSIQVTLHVNDDAGDAGQALLDRAAQDVRARLGRYIFSEHGDVDFPQAVAAQVAAHPARPTVAVAESCTGGLVASMITAVPGVSAWFHEGVVTYANAAKTRLLGVSEDLLTQHGAVSEAVARAMAEGVRRRAGTTLGLATTGIAGPAGGTPDKPVGTVHVAMATEDTTVHRLLRLPFDRERNRVVTAWTALELVRRWSARDADHS